MPEGVGVGKMSGKSGCRFKRTVIQQSESKKTLKTNSMNKRTELKRKGCETREKKSRLYEFQGQGKVER